MGPSRGIRKSGRILRGKNRSPRRGNDTGAPPRLGFHENYAPIFINFVEAAAIGNSKDHGRRNGAERIIEESLHVVNARRSPVIRLDRCRHENYIKRIILLAGGRVGLRELGPRSPCSRGDRVVYEYGTGLDGSVRCLYLCGRSLYYLHPTCVCSLMSAIRDCHWTRDVISDFVNIAFCNCRFISLSKSIHANAVFRR